MGKKGGQSGVNSKVAAAKEKQAAVAEGRSAKQRAEQEAAEARDWAQGAKGTKREEEAIRKQEEKMAKLASKKALAEEEEQQLKGFKAVVKPKGKKVDIPPWEAALVSSATSNKEKKRQEAARKQKEADEARKAKAERAEAEAKALRDQGIHMADDTAPMSGNPNRQDGALGEDWASGIDAALGSLSMDSGSGGAERHPEKRLKAAFLAYEEKELPGLKEEKPGLKLRQYKQIIFEQWKKSPENPVNRARAAEAAEAAAAAGRADKG